MSLVFEDRAESGEEWSRKATWMRSVGATAAVWGVSGQLLELQLGPEPANPDETATREAETNQTETPEAALARHRRIATGAASGLVKRTG